MTRRKILAVAAIAAVLLTAGAVTKINLSTQVQGVLGVVNGGTGSNNPQGAASAIFPARVRAGDIIFNDGANWVVLPGNNSGTNVLQENSSGVPSWAADGAGGGVTSVGLTAPSWFAVAGSPVTSSGTLALTAAGAQTSHQVIGTCGIATSFGPCALVAADIPQLAYSSLSGLPTLFYQTVQNASGTPQTQRSAVEFTGTAVSSVVDDSANNRTVVTLTASAGSGMTVQTNGTNNTSQTALNFVNPSAFQGLSFTFSNPTGGNETFSVSGSLNAAAIGALPGSSGQLLYNNAGAIGAEDPVVSQPTAALLNATVVQGTSPWVVSASGNFGVTQQTSPWVSSVTAWGGGTLGAMANYGTSPGAVLVPGVNAFITNTPAVTGSGNFTVTQGTGTNLHTVVDSGSITVTQATGTNLHTVVDSGAITATLNAETTKVIGVTRNADGAGNLWTSNSTTPAAHFAQDVNITSILGTAPTTVGFLDVKGADGNVFVRQATGSNLHTVVDSGSLTVTQSTGTNLHVVCDSGCGGAATFGDNAAFTAGSTAVNITAGWFSNSPTACTTGSACAPSLTSDRKLFVQAFQGTSPWVVSQGTGTNLHTVTDSGSVTNATLSAETTKVIGTVNISSGQTVGLVAGSAVIGHVITDTNSVTDVSDRAARLLGVVYGSQGQQLKQTATNFNAQVELATGATLYDARQIRALTSADVVTTAPPSNASTNVAQVAATTLGAPQTFGTAPTGVVLGTSSDIYASGTRVRSNQSTTAAGALDVNIVGLLGSTAVASATGVLKVGITGNAGAAVDAATGAAPPANVVQIGGLKSGATGGLMTAITVCDQDDVVNISTATTTLAITGVSGRQVRICSFNLVTAGANNVAFIEGTGATCGTGTAGMTGGTTAASGWNFAANGGITQGSGLGEVMSTATAGDSVCIVTSAGTQLSGHIKFGIY